MIVRTVRKLFARPARAGRGKMIAMAQHGLSASHIGVEAAHVVKTLQDAGYETYVVGGALRDLLLGIQPKDFDVSTSATPSQVRGIFRRSRIIGRRFQIVHVYERRGGMRHYTEVTTFRAGGDKVVQDSRGRIVLDNAFGSASEDALRRDFTCNALFYNPADGKIVDHAGGYQDIAKRRLRVIGSPHKRFQQDPLRILRAFRMEFKLGLAPDKETLKAMSDNAPMLLDIPKSRVFDEVVKILKSGAAHEIVQHFRERGVLQYVLPVAQQGDDVQWRALDDVDKNADGSVSVAVAGLFWPEVRRRWVELKKEMSPYQAMEEAADEAQFYSNPIFPRRIIAKVKDIYFLQARMELRPTVRRGLAIVRHRMFHRACAFAAVREGCGGDDIREGAAQWWREFRECNSRKRQRMIKEREEQMESGEHEGGHE